MFKLFQVMKEEGEDAVRRTIWILCAAILFVIAIAFLAAASSIALSQVVSMPIALMISAGGVVIVALVCLIIAGIDSHNPAPAVAAKTQAPAGMNLISSGGLIDQATQKMLLQQVKARPASVLAIAAAAGLAVAALDAFDGD